MIKRNDFVELEFTGREKEGNIFDTNKKEDAEKIGIKITGKRFIVCVGQEMVVKGLDKEFEGKEIGKSYTIELSAKEAFGDRKKELIRLIPLKVFTDKKIFPKAGMVLTLDNHLVRIASSSGGRVLVDFNNPLSGKEIIYEFKIKQLIEDDKEKINSLLEYFLKQEIDFEVKDKKIVLKVEDFFEPVIKMLNDKFKNILKLEFVINNKKVEKVEKDGK